MSHALGRPLAIVPTYITDDRSLDLTKRCLASLDASAGRIVDGLVVDDGSPRQDLVDEMELGAQRLGFEVHRKESNGGFAQTINVGLATARAEDRDALLVNADVEFFEAGWLEAMGQRLDDDDGVYVVGAQLLFPSGLIQHAGIYYSVLSRQFDHIYRFAPGGLPAAQVRRTCPVTAALHLIRAESLQIIGIYDEEFRMGWEDVDYCLRVFQAGRRCEYEPSARAIHHEKMFRGHAPSETQQRWQDDSLRHLHSKHAGASFAEYVPTLLVQGEGQ